MGDGTVQVVHGQAGAALIGHSIGDLMMQHALCVFGLVCNGAAMLPQPTLQIQAGDVLHLSVRADGVEHVQQMLKG